jgi:hypothetical protein
MDLEELSPLQEALNADSPDFTAEDALSAVETNTPDDFIAKVVEFVKNHDGPSHQTSRKIFNGVNYHVVISGESKAIFKMGWLPR